MNCHALEQIPFFVYGTLIPGQPNDHLWGGGIRHVETAVFRRGKLYDMGYYPMIVEGSGGNIRGKLVSVAGGVYEDILTRLDDLEGYLPDQAAKSTYRRVRREVTSDSGRRVLSWVYVGRRDQARGSKLIPGGDWVDYAAGMHSQLQNWWESIDTVLGRHDGAEDPRS